MISVPILIPTKLRLMWDIRPLREQVMLIILVVFIIATVFESLVYQPLRNHHTQISNQLVKASDQYRWLHTQVQLIRSMQNNLTGTNLITMTVEQKYSTLKKSLDDNNMDFKIKERTNKGKEKIVEIVLPSIAGKDLMQWVFQRVKSGYILDNMSAKLLKKNRVKATVIFRL